MHASKTTILALLFAALLVLAGCAPALRPSLQARQETLTESSEEVSAEGTLEAAPQSTKQDSGRPSTKAAAQQESSQQTAAQTPFADPQEESEEAQEASRPAASEAGPAAPMPESSTCSSTEYGGHTYALYRVGDVPAGMRIEEYCASLGGYLASLTSEEEKWAVSDMIAASGHGNALFGPIYDPQSAGWHFPSGEPADYTWADFNAGDLDMEGSTEKQYSAFWYNEAWDNECVERVSANYLVEGGRQYVPENLVDMDNATAWVEGAACQGIGETVHFALSSATLVHALDIYSGYQKRDDLYMRNSRPSRMRSTFHLADGSSYSKQFDLADTMDLQTISFDPIPLATGFDLEILDVYPGSECEDTAISGIRVAGMYPDTVDFMTYDAQSLDENQYFVCEWDEADAPADTAQ